MAEGGGGLVSVEKGYILNWSEYKGKPPPPPIILLFLVSVSNGVSWSWFGGGSNEWPFGA